MDLLLVTGRFPERSETFIYRKAVGLASRGHRVTMAVREVGDWSLYPAAVPETLTVTRLVPDGSLRTPSRALGAVVGALRETARAPLGVRRLYELCARRTTGSGPLTRSFLRHLSFVSRHVDVVHFEFLSLATMYPLTQHLLDAPVVVSCRGNDVHTLELRSASEREAGIAVLRGAHAVHCVSEEMAHEVTRISGRTSGIWINRPAVPTDAISVRRASRPSEPVRLLATGRLVWKKGFDYLLAALARLARRGIRFHAEILGDGELRHFLRYSVEDLGLSEYVTLVGGLRSSEVLERMQRADIFVLSSFEEGISNAVLEAMASGLPIVTTNAGGMAEVITDGVEGYVVPVREVALLTHRIEHLIGSHELRVTMGRAARARVEAHFSLSRQIETFEHMYRAAVGGPP